MSYYPASKHSPGAEVEGRFPYPLPPPAAYTHPIQEFTRKKVSSLPRSRFLDVTQRSPHC